MIKEYETTVSKIIYYDKNRKTNFWRTSVKFHLWVPLKALRYVHGVFTAVSEICVVLELCENARIDSPALLTRPDSLKAQTPEQRRHSRR